MFEGFREASWERGMCFAVSPTEQAHGKTHRQIWRPVKRSKRTVKISIDVDSQYARCGCSNAGVYLEMSSVLRRGRRQKVCDPSIDLSLRRRFLSTDFHHYKPGSRAHMFQGHVPGNNRQTHTPRVDNRKTPDRDTPWPVSFNKANSLSIVYSSVRRDVAR